VGGIQKNPSQSTSRTPSSKFMTVICATRTTDVTFDVPRNRLWIKWTITEQKPTPGGGQVGSKARTSLEDSGK